MDGDSGILLFPSVDPNRLIEIMLPEGIPDVNFLLDFNLFLTSKLKAGLIQNFRFI
jgi:hypothetical protein